MPRPITRRVFLAAAPVAAIAPTGAPGWAQALADRVEHLGGPGLLRSYDVAGGGDFDLAHGNTAYVYDNAVVALALLLRGETRLAQRLGDALLTAQGTDRYFHDGRLRNAYAAGAAPVAGAYPLPGWWNARQERWVEDAYQAGSATGVVAWAILLWIQLHRITGTLAYLNAANRAADFVERKMRGPAGYTGGFFGFEPAQRQETWVSTEHNVDLAAGFAALGRIAAADHARTFVASMWSLAEGRFYSGLRPDGSKNDHSAVDANLWPGMASGARREWDRALDWVLAKHGLPAGEAPSGVDFNTDRDGMWLEGTAITASALRRAGRGPEFDRFMMTLRAQTTSSGLIWACSTPILTTGLSTGNDPNQPDFLYYRRPHIAPVGWAVMAASGLNPFPSV
jgi:hypothetical protein